MKDRRRTTSRLTIFVALLISLLVLSWTVLAQPEDSFDLSWWTVNGGGGASTGGGFTLHGTAGQPDAGAMSGSTFEFAGGFWAGISAETPMPTATATSTPPVTGSPTPAATPTPGPPIYLPIIRR